jgi:hypothetical protein
MTTSSFLEVTYLGLAFSSIHSQLWLSPTRKMNIDRDGYIPILHTHILQLPTHLPGIKIPQRVAKVLSRGLNAYFTRISVQCEWT